MTVSGQAAKRTQRSSAELAPPAEWFQDGFHRFLRPYLKRHFHSIAINEKQRIESGLQPDLPLIVYANHPSWWDPLVAHFLNRQLMGGRQFYAPIDADALQQYRVFEKLGFFGVKLSSKAGAASFLTKSLAILERSDTALWITPEGRFADPRDHSAELMPGLAHLCNRLDRGRVLPVALEYVFWEERLPECLVATGHPICVEDHAGDSKDEWTGRLSEALRSTQNRLAELAIARSSDPFENLLQGARGGGWIYDTCRRLKAWMSGRSFKASHGDQFE